MERAINLPVMNPWKVLLVVVLACACAVGLVVAGGVYWFVSSRHHAATPNDFFSEDNPRPTRRVASNARLLAPVTSAKNAILAAKNDGKSFPGDDIFKDLAIPQLRIVLAREEYSTLSRNPREYVRATFHEGDTVYTNVAFRLKGGPGSYQDLRNQPSFTVNFDKFAEGQTFHGLKKIHLNSSVQDRSYLEEKISRELFDAADVPAPRAGHAIVTLNNRELGLYVLVEGVNKQFLKRYFKDATGNVYDGHSGSDVNQNMPTNSGDDRRDKSRLRALAVAARQPDLGVRLTELEKTLDLDRFLSFVAMETILGHWDGYTRHRNNFRVFHDRATDRMVFIPQGLDQTFNKANEPLIPEMGGLVARAAFEIPKVRERYMDRLAEISTNVFVPEAIASRVDEVSERVQVALGETDPSAAETFQATANALKRRVGQRSRFLLAQLFPSDPIKFDEGSTVALKEWKPRRDLGEADLTQEKDDQGNQLLRITTENGCTASWRTSALLQNGKYRLEARIKTEGVVLAPNNPRAGAGLRISRVRTGQKNSGDKDWTAITYDFEVAEEESDVELVCELFADAGTIWYDLNSLKLTRL